MELLNIQVLEYIWDLDNTFITFQINNFPCQSPASIMRLMDNSDRQIANRINAELSFEMS